MFKFSALLASLWLIALTPAHAVAQANYPSKPVRYVVPFAAGGLTDNMARLVGQQLNEIWKQPVVVDNRPGGNANIGAEVVARAPADGYTVLGITLTHAINVSLFPKLPYNLEKDFVPVTQFASSPLVLVVNAATPVKSVSELVAWAKSKPLNYGSSGNGTPPHLGMELFKSMAKLEMTHVPYKGGAPSVIDLLGGQIDLIMANLPEVLPHVKAGKLRALAVSTKQRNPLLPEVPTLAEAGYPDYEVSNWAALVVPAGTPREVVAKIEADVATVLQKPEVRQKLEASGFVPVGSTSDQFGAFLKAEIEKWGKVVKESGAKVD